MCDISIHAIHIDTRIGTLGRHKSWKMPLAAWLDPTEFANDFSKEDYAFLCKYYPIQRLKQYIFC